MKQLAEGLTPVAYAPDGLVEAFEMQSHPFGLAVQWHPEWLPDDESSGRLFELVGSGAVKIEVKQTFPLAEASAAHVALESRRTTGSTVLLP